MGDVIVGRIEFASWTPSVTTGGQAWGQCQPPSHVFVGDAKTCVCGKVKSVAVDVRT